jgi:hypothetical protein
VLDGVTWWQSMNAAIFIAHGIHDSFAALFITGVIAGA